MEEELNKLTLILTKRKTVKFSNFIYWAHFLQVFRLVSISAKRPCTKDAYGAPEVQVQSWSARSPGPKLEAPRYPSNDLFCLSFSPLFDKDTFALRSGF